MIKRRIFKGRHESRTSFFLRSFWICWGEYLTGVVIGCVLAFLFYLGV